MAKTQEGNKTKSGKSKGPAKAKDIGFGITPPSEECRDMKCPFHGDLQVRGRPFTAVVVRNKAQRTAIVGWLRSYYLPKYERYEKRRTRLHVHNPSCIGAVEGDKVRVMECRPLSKTKNFVIVKKTGHKDIINEGEAEEIKKPAKENAAKEIAAKENVVKENGGGRDSVKKDSGA
ncbi:MAG: 30S ribosomal protein S17 [Candidatus Woesearchaeota archaeon]